MALSLPGPVISGPLGQQLGGQATIPLGRLIDFVLQKTWHELNILAELLPRKSDMERKVEITTFTNSTRQLFVRLLALVKWAASAGKVEKCASIVNFLDKQSMLFIETADMFAMLARDTLVQARLPSFHVPCAAEILTTGTYSRLPTCIRDKIVPSDPISAEDKMSTLGSLNRILQYKLVSAELPYQMRSPRIERGRVFFHVDNEFELSLTLMGDGPQIPWRLLTVKILVEDKDTGDCKALVHPLQILYIHQLAQSRLIDHPKPLHELYECLHFFCLSLQLEVLHTQTIRLCRERLGDSVRIDEYIPGTLLKLNFWKEHCSPHDQQQSFFLIIHIDEEDPAQPLQVSHLPEIRDDEELVWIDRRIQSEFLSVERLLIQTIHIRSRQKLSYLRDSHLKNLLPVDCKCTLGGSPPLLQIPIVYPCSSSEHLVLTVDTHTGYVMAFVPQYEPPMIQELQDIMNTAASATGAEPSLKARLATALLNLKFWITMMRCRKTVQHLPVLAMEANPVTTTMPRDHPLERLGKFTLFVKLCKHVHHFVVIELRAEKLSDTVEFSYYLMSVTGGNQLSSFHHLNSQAIIHGPCTDLDLLTTTAARKKDTGGASLKRCQLTEGPQGALVASKKPRFAGYFLSDVAHIVAFCDDRLAFCSFTRELGQRGICHRGLQIEGAQTNFCVTIVKMPSCPDIPERVADELQRSLLSCTFRLQMRSVKAWHCELIFHDCPLLTTSQIGERGATRPIHFHYDFSQNQTALVIDEWLTDWSIVCKLYSVVVKYAANVKRAKYAALLEMSEVRSYSYKRLTIGYGSTEKNYTVTIYWRPVEKRFQLVFGVVGNSVSATNPHSIIAHQLSYDFNQHESIIELLQTLRDTYRPLLSLSRLPSVLQLGVINSRPQVPVQTFMIIPQSSTCFRLVYRAYYCLEVQCRKGDGCVSVRDGAFSHFDKGRHVEEYVQIPGLRAFLTKFARQPSSAAAILGGSDPDTTNPPAVSPLQMECVDAFLSPSMAKAGSPAAAAATARSTMGETSSTLRFAQHHPKTPPSNPHTPASPHPSMLPSNYTASPNSSFVHTPSNIPPSSPLAAAPSPYPVNSPHMTSPSPSPAQQQVTSTPGFTSASDPVSPAFALHSASPAANAWPSSPAPPRPSPRQFQQSPGGPSPAPSTSVDAASSRVATSMSRSAPAIPGNWAAAISTVLTHGTLDFLCTSSPPNSPLCPLEASLGCAFMRCTIQRITKERNDENSQLRNMSSSEPGVVTFRLEQLLYRVALHPQSMQSLHLKISHSDAVPVAQQFSADDLQVIERYFDTKVVSIPHKPNAFISFTRLMSTPQRILRDFVQLMRLELCPTLSSPMFRWNLQLCLTIPPAAPPIAPPGMTAVVMAKNKMLFFLQLSPIRAPATHSEPPPAAATANRSSSVVVVPMVYDLQTNVLSTATDRRTEANPQASHALGLISSFLRRANEYHNTSECSIYPSIRELLIQLTVN